MLWIKSFRRPAKDSSFKAFLKAFLFTLTLIPAISLVVFAQPNVGQGAAGAAGVETSGLITLDFKDADIRTVLRVMSIKSGVNIVAGPEVQGTVTIRLENVHWERALEVVLRTYDYVYERTDNIIRVTTREKMQQEPVVTQTFILNYSKASEIQDAVQDMLTERGRVKTSERTNTLIITDIPANLFRIGQVVVKLDKMTPQAYIDSKIVNTTVGAAENLGIQWTVQSSISGSSRPTTFPFATKQGPDGRQEDALAPQITDFFPVIVGDEGTPNTTDPRAFPFPAGAVTGDTFALGTLDFSNFSSILQLLQQKSNTKVISNPRIVVLNNQTAKVQVGNDIPLPTFERNENTGSVEITGFSFREVGVVLNVTPHINSEEEILVELHPEVSRQSDTISFGDFQVPSFSVTTAITQVLIHSGETIAIGGLLTDNTSMNEQRIPWLADIPLFGKIFRSKRQTAGDSNQKVETLFFVTVTMVDTEGQPTGEGASLKYRKSDNMPEGGPAQQGLAMQSPGVPPETGGPQTGQDSVMPPQNQETATV